MARQSPTARRHPVKQLRWRPCAVASTPTPSESTSRVPPGTKDSTILMSRSLPTSTESEHTVEPVTSSWPCRSSWRVRTSTNTRRSSSCTSSRGTDRSFKRSPARRYASPSGQLAAAVAAELGDAVRLNQVVTGVTHTAGECEVVRDDGSVMQAQVVIMAVPVNCLDAAPSSVSVFRERGWASITGMTGAATASPGVRGAQPGLGSSTVSASSRSIPARCCSRAGAFHAAGSAGWKAPSHRGRTLPAERRPTFPGASPLRRRAEPFAPLSRAGRP